MFKKEKRQCFPSVPKYSLHFTRHNFCSTKTEKTTQALSVHEKGTFCIYIECLIASYDQNKKSKKSQSLAFWFEQMMEFLDASDEEASPTNPKKREMLKNACHQIVSMLQAMETSDCLCQGSVTSITKRFSMACSMVYILWGCMESMHAMGIIDSPELNSQKKIQEALYLSERVCSRGCQE